MKRGINYLFDLGTRYFILIILGVLGIGVFHTIFLPLTIYPVFFLLKIFFDVSLTSNFIFVNNLPIEIIGPCIAGSAYYLLLILNLATPKIKIGNRINLLLLSFLSLLIINILRIFILSIMFVSGVSLFDITHKLFWYLGSTIFVVGIWFLNVKIFKIKEVPFYSDIKYLLDNSKKKMKKTKRSKKH